MAAASVCAGALPELPAGAALEPVAEVLPVLVFAAVIDGWLMADLDAPRKQRHTARRVWQRLVAEHGASMSESTVSRYVARRRVELGLAAECLHHLWDANIMTDSKLRIRQPVQGPFRLESI